MAETTIYLDNAAATPLDERVLAAMQPFLTDQFYNPSATYQAARAVRKEVDAARARVAHWFGARPNEIVFTAGGTEANNIAINGVMKLYPEGNVIVSGVEHDSVLQTAESYPSKVAPVLSDGTVDIPELIKLIDDNTVLVSVMYGNNEVGTIQPIRALVLELNKIRALRSKAGNVTPLHLHVDACQTSQYLDLHVSRLGVDLMSINASKIYGPKQVGALYVRSDVTIHPFITGGGQERDVRSGTENVSGIIGLAEALDIAQKTKGEEVSRMQTLQKLFFELLADKIPSAVINGSKKHRLPNNVHITLPGHDNERLMMELDDQGIQCAVGSACSASNEEPSHVLKAMGLSDSEAQASLRFTMGRQTTEDDVRHVVDVLAKLVS